MSARQATYELMHRLSSRGIELSFDEANTLRRAEHTLQRWAELECGDGNDYASWAIERDENGEGPPYMVRHHYPATCKPWTSRARIADREAGALRRIQAICKAHGLSYYHQSDPRGCALYVSREPIRDHDYTRGVACCA